jgi:cobalamin biosynthesis protein CobD/CbiB
MKKNKTLMIIFGLIMWPIIIATPLVISEYLMGLAKSELKFGEIPEAQLMLGIMSGLFGALIFIGISYFIAFIIKKIVSGAHIFFVITCLLTVLFIATNGKKVIDVLSLEKDNVEIMQKRIQEIMD